jgi:transcriptional regulator with XRE-family HTH domain
MNLSEWMKRHGLTQVQAAERLKVTQSEISGYLRGRLPKSERMKTFETLTSGELDMGSWPAFSLAAKGTRVERNTSQAPEAR